MKPNEQRRYAVAALGFALYVLSHFAFIHVGLGVGFFLAFSALVTLILASQIE